MVKNVEIEVAFQVDCPLTSALATFTRIVTFDTKLHLFSFKDKVVEHIVSEKRLLV